MKKFYYLIVLLLFLILNNIKSYEHWIREDWKLLPVIYIDGFYKLTSSYCDFFFIDSLNALMSKSSGVQGANIFKTTDGGYTWNYVLTDTIIWKDGIHDYVPAYPSSFNVYNGISVLGTVNRKTNLQTFSKDSGMVWISLDSGLTWRKNYTGLKSGILDVRVLKNGNIIVLSNYHTAKSLDTGKTWIKSTQFPDKVNDSTLWINPYDSSKNIMTYWSPNFIEYQDENDWYSDGDEVQMDITTILGNYNVETHTTPRVAGTVQRFPNENGDKWWRVGKGDYSIKEFNTHRTVDVMPIQKYPLKITSHLALAFSAFDMDEDESKNTEAIIDGVEGVLEVALPAEWVPLAKIVAAIGKAWNRIGEGNDSKGYSGSVKLNSQSNWGSKTSEGHDAIYRNCIYKFDSPNSHIHMEFQITLH